VKHFLIFMFLAAQATGTVQGDTRWRIRCNFPAPKGILEHYYVGDSWDFFGRSRFSLKKLDLVVFTDKSGGEEWGDVTAGGINLRDFPGKSGNVAAGWLRARLGPGTVFSAGDKLTDPSEFTMYKPPATGNRIRPASSSRTCREEPLTGAGCVIGLGNVEFALLAAYSRLDSIGGGYHRTASQVDARGTVGELLGVTRVSVDRAGLALTTGRRNGTGTEEWTRCGLDWSVPVASFGLSGELSLGMDSGGTSASFWNSISYRGNSFRSSFILLRNPENFPRQRSSSPISRTCDLGAVIAARWGTASRGVLEMGCGVYFEKDDDMICGTGSFSRRLAEGLEGSLGMKARIGNEESVGRGWARITWRPHSMISVREKTRFTHWKTSEPDSTETGSGVEIRVSLKPWTTTGIDMGGAACSTDGYNSRIYAGNCRFPGEFGATALYGKMLLLFCGLTVKTSEYLTLRLCVSRHTAEGVSSMGTGWEETLGNSRTKTGFQLDYEF